MFSWTFLLLGLCCRTGIILKNKLKGWVIFLLPVRVNSLHHTSAFSVLSLHQHSLQRKGDFPLTRHSAATPYCQPSLVARGTEIRRQALTVTHRSCQQMSKANRANTVNSNCKRDFPVSFTIRMSVEFDSLCQLSKRNASKKVQSITKERM